MDEDSCPACKGAGGGYEVDPMLPYVWVPCSWCMGSGNADDCPTEAELDAQAASR